MRIKYKVHYTVPFANHAFGCELSSKTWRGAYSYLQANQYASMYKEYGYIPCYIEEV